MLLHWCVVCNRDPCIERTKAISSLVRTRSIHIQQTQLACENVAYAIWLLQRLQHLLRHVIHMARIGHSLTVSAHAIWTKIVVHCYTSVGMYTQKDKLQLQHACMLPNA